MKNVNVIYIGARDTWTDNLYGTNNVFKKGVAYSLPEDVAKRFLKHTDCFAMSNSTTKKDVENVDVKILKDNYDIDYVIDINQKIDSFTNVKSLQKFIRENFDYDAKSINNLVELKTLAKSLNNRFGVE